MYLELHDTEVPDTLAAAIGRELGIDSDYQAEQWVQDTFGEGQTQNTAPNRWIVCWILFDAQGERARWERASGDPGRPKLVRAAARYAGFWKVGT